MKDPRSLGRLAGALYLVPTLLGPFGMIYVPRAIFVRDDPVATLDALAHRQGTLRAGLASDVVIVIAELLLVVVLQRLFAPAGRSLARGAAYARLAMTTLQAANLVPTLLALALVGEGAYPTLRPDDRATLVHLFFSTRELVAQAWEILFAVHLALVAALVHRARGRTVPRVFAPLLAVAALGYLVDGLGRIVAPTNAPVFEAVVAVAAVVGELPFVLFLAVRGAAAELVRAAAPS